MSLTIKYCWNEEDFPAYVQQNHRFWHLLMDGQEPEKKLKTDIAYHVYYLGPAIITTLFLLLIQYIDQFMVFDTEINLITLEFYCIIFFCVWISTYIATSIYTKLTRQNIDYNHYLFEDLKGIQHEVTFDNQGFTISGGGMKGQYFWKDQPTNIEIWGDHLLILHPRMHLVIPKRYYSGTLSSLAKQIDDLRQVMPPAS